jgi:SAM-dependent methyltransferase
MPLSESLRARTLARFEEHRQAWDENPALRLLYGDWYGRVAAELPPPALGPRLELGSGPGFARAFIPDLQLSDIVRAPWHDREVSAEALPFADVTLGALVLFDVLHHLPSPRRFFAEAARVLRRGGRLVMCEPYVSPLSYPIYKFFHDEPLALRVDPLAGFDRQAADDPRDPFDSNQAIPTLLFGRRRRLFVEAFPSLAIVRVTHLSGPSYPASGGFSRRPLLPPRLWSALHRIEARLPEVIFRAVGFRMLIVIEKR